MKQLLILSGKGGTGKTTIASAFIKLSDAKAFSDCDVDAPNLHLIMSQDTEPVMTDYYGLPKAEIDSNKCISCDKCREYCRFNAIAAEENYKVNTFACEGCGVCEYVCPSDAIKLKPFVDGNLMLYANDKKVFSTAQLKMGSGTSGMLVSEVKNQMKKNVLSKTNLAIIDGSPGIGCPVIASLSGVDMVLIVAEPSVSGISDMKRIVDTALKFGTKIAVCINKFDINITNSEKIEEFCRKEGISFLGKVPFDSKAVKAINIGKTIIDIECESGKATKELYRNSIELLYE